jgi:site-specific DNA recombinase
MPEKLRCVVYTRKSSEEGLDQSFNSLDAQREACEAYIKSQSHEGWILNAPAYADGGFSGGTMARPSFQRLLADIRETMVDIVVVYKVDRLTRSLSDFARMVEIFDTHQTSFVSVTQQFNTTSSMGRLTLNVLLSFAQFEREVTGERIRDKISASRRRGLWTGGTTPLGYRAANRVLVPHDPDAKLIRTIYRRFLILGNTNALSRELRARDCKRDIQITERGKKLGGGYLGRGTLDHILRNKIYCGFVTHNGVALPGQHQPIVSRQQWDLVQSKITQRLAEQKQVNAVKNPNILRGRIWDELGNLMQPRHARNGNGQRYRYYVGQTSSKETATSVLRVPAKMIEELVEREIIKRFSSWHTRKWRSASHFEKINILRGAVLRVVVGRREVGITVMPDVAMDRSDCLVRNATCSDKKPVFIPVAVKIVPWGGTKNIVSLDGKLPNQTSPSIEIVRLILRVLHRLDRLRRREVDTVEVISNPVYAGREEIDKYLTLAFLSPRIVTALLDRDSPFQGTLSELVKISKIIGWADQERAIFAGKSQCYPQPADSPRR